MPDFRLKFTGKIDRRSPRSEGEADSPVIRENWLARNGRLQKPRGTTKEISGITDIVRWMGRYHTIEVGQVSPKTFAYSEDGKLWVLDDNASTATEIKSELEENVNPRHWLFKVGEQTKLYLVDGKYLYKYDGNNDNQFDIISVTDNSGSSIEPIDIIEHKDRLILLSKTSVYISKNLEPETFNDSNDSIQIIVGSGKGENIALGKIEDRLYIFTTEGIFVLLGDVISALAATFEVSLADERKIIARGSLQRVENALIFLADDYELWSWDGTATQMLTYNFILKDSVFKNKDMIRKAVSTYYDNYYQLSFVENGEVEPKLELWFDSFENNIDIVRGRNVSCYMKTDPTIETEYMQLGRSDEGSIMFADRGTSFGGTAIATRLRTRDIYVKKGHNVRFIAFYPEIIATGNVDIDITYLLDGRLSNPGSANAFWEQNLRGEVKTLGMINIKNQGQFIDRIQPKINYARGESIAFEIIDATLNQDAILVSMGIEFIVKESIRGKAVGV